MNVRTIACPAAGFSAALSLLGLNISSPIGIGFAKTLTSIDVFDVYGTLDSAAADATNATSIGRLAGSAGANLDPKFIKKMMMWPYVILQRVSGAGAGNFEAAGNLDAAPAIASAALPASGSYTALMDLTGLEATVRIGTSRQQTIADTFEVYVTNDATINPAVTGTAGAFKAGLIAGGGESAGQLSSLVVQGYAYAFLKRTGGTTAGNALAASSSVPATSGIAWLIGGNTLPAGTQIVGTLNAGAILSVVAGGKEILASDGVITAIGNPESLVAGSALQLTAGAGGGQFAVTGAGGLDLQTDSGIFSIDTQGGAITIGVALGIAKTITIGNAVGATGVGIRAGSAGFGVQTASAGPIAMSTDTTGSVTIDSGTTGAMNWGTGANAKVLTFGNGTLATSIALNVGTGGIAVGSNPTDHVTTVGSVTVRSLTTIQGGTDGVTIQPSATGPLTAKSGTSGDATFDSGSTGAVHIGDGANQKAVTVGSVTLAASLALRAGTGGLTIVNNGATWTWPTALGAAGTKLTDAVGNGVLSFT